MGHIITLPWKEFSVNLEKVTAHFKATLSSNYDGIVCKESVMEVNFFEEISQEDSDDVYGYWDNITASTFNPTLDEIITKKVNEASIFGNNLIAKAIVENIAMGITQAGKTKAVADLFSNLQYYLKTGSLYAAVAEIDRMVNDGVDPSLDPFVTEERLNNYKSQIQAYLST